MTSAPRRRWFRFAFSLRTLFIVVTIFGVWLGWNASIVRERKAVLRELEDVRRKVVVKMATSANNTPLSKVAPGSKRDFRYLDISLIRQLLGDEPYVEIYLPEWTPPELLERTESAFPETERFCDWWDGPAAFRDSLLKPPYRDGVQFPSEWRQPNTGNIFKTGLIEK